jgi:hypothetical protein
VHSVILGGRHRYILLRLAVSSSDGEQGKHTPGLLSLVLSTVLTDISVGQQQSLVKSKCPSPPTYRCVYMSVPIFAAGKPKSAPVGLQDGNVPARG